MVSSTTLRVRHAAGRIFLDSTDVRRERDIRTVRLALSGGVLQLDVEHPDPVPSIELIDLDAASWWLASVIGGAAAELLLDETMPAEGTEFEAVPESETSLFDVLRRLALALWLKRWAPTSGVSREWLLDAEAGVLAFRADDALDPGQPLAATLLEPVLSKLVSAASRHYQPLAGDGDGEIIAKTLVDALDAAVEVADPGTEGFDDALEVLGVISREEANITGALARFESEVAENAGNLAVHAGHTTAPAARVISEGCAPVDPLAVPARVISPRGTALGWKVYQGGEADPESVGLRCELTAAAAETAAPARRDLQARFDYGGRMAVADLRLDKFGELYRGEAWLDASASLNELEDAQLHVFGGVPGAEKRPPRTYDQRIQDRDAVASVIAVRVELLDERASDTAPQWSRPFATELSDVIDQQLP